MTITNLNASSFNVINGHLELVMNQIPVYTLVMFHSETCPSCVKFMPFFQKASTVFPHVKFAAINLTRNRQIIQMSQQTSTPISNVPKLVFYFNGEPKAVYNKVTYNMNDMGNFLNDMKNKYKQATGFSRTSIQPQSIPQSIPQPRIPQSIPQAMQQHYVPQQPQQTYPQGNSHYTNLKQQQTPEQYHPTPYNAPYMAYIGDNAQSFDHPVL